MNKGISPEAMEFLKRYGFLDALGVGRMLDAFHAERMKADEERNREQLATNVRNWIEDLQPTDLRNRSTAELQDEIQRRQTLAEISDGKV